MPTKNHVLYIENDPFELDSLAELIERDGFRVSKATTVKEAEQILQDNQIHLILIDINSSGDTHGQDALTLINDPLYTNIPKIAIVIDQEDPNNSTLKNASSLIYISYKQDPQRLEKLMAALKSI